MKKAYRFPAGIGKKNLEKLEVVNGIIEEFQNKGYRLTLRQLYYQLVSRDLIDNKKSEYAKLSTLLVKGRMGGLVDWDAIEDRLRVPKFPYQADDIADAMDDIIYSYRLDRQKGQEKYIELWVEKDALSSVLQPLTKKYHVRLMVNRGYSSCTAMRDAYLRIQSANASATILYLGDHDPSGLDMVRDITERLNEFGVFPEVKHIGLTKEQINEFNPPPNPARVEDPRAENYIAEHGYVSWEVDALSPETLNELIKSEIEGLLDMDKFNEVIEQEEIDKDKMREFATE